MTREQWDWLATRQREITDDDGYRFKFSNDWDEDGLPIVTIVGRYPRGLFRYSHPFRFFDNIPDSVRNDLHNLWEITRENELGY